MHGFTRVVKIARSCLGLAMKCPHSELGGPFKAMSGLGSLKS